LGEQLDLGRVGIPRGEPQRRKGRQEQIRIKTRNPKFETNPNDKNTNVINSLEFTFVV
jgi:hypothetical protein